MGIKYEITKITSKLDPLLDYYIKLDDVKNYLRVAHDNDNTFIQLAIKAALKYIENYTQYMITETLIEYTIEYDVSTINSDYIQRDIIYPPYRPITDVVSLKLDGVEAVLYSYDDYKIVSFNSEYSKLELEYYSGVMNVNEGEPETPVYNVIEPDLYLVLLKIIADMYYNRTSQIKITPDVEMTLDKYRVIKL